MKDLNIKQKVLQEITDLMDQKEGDMLKKHPKLIAAKVEVEKPEEDELEMDLDSAPVEKKAEGEEELTPEQIQMLLEKFQELK